VEEKFSYERGKTADCGTIWLLSHTFPKKPISFRASCDVGPVNPRKITECRAPDFGSTEILARFRVGAHCSMNVKTAIAATLAPTPTAQAAARGNGPLALQPDPLRTISARAGTHRSAGTMHRTAYSRI